MTSAPRPTRGALCRRPGAAGAPGAAEAAAVSTSSQSAATLKEGADSPRSPACGHRWARSLQPDSTRSGGGGGAGKQAWRAEN